MHDTRDLSLYCYDSCFYCVRVRRAMQRIGVEIEQRDVLRDPEHRAALVAATGRRRVPVLRIESEDGSARWMPESLDIVAYLEQRFGGATGP